MNMPRFDGTGPQGNGPKTGRGMGGCSDVDVDGKERQYFNNNAQQCAKGFGCRFGFGRRNMGQGRGFRRGNR
jgi:hypothetical protein